MRITPNPNSKLSRFQKLVLLSYVPISSLISLSLITFVFIPFSLHDTGYENAVKEQIKKIIDEQKENYKYTGNFTSKYSELPDKKRYIARSYKVEIKTKSNQLIIAIRHSSLKKDREKTSFGIINILRFKQIHNLNSNQLKRNKIKWQYLDMESFVCSSEKIGTPLPSDIELTNISDKCPVGYIQHSIDKQLNIDHN